MPPLQPSQSTSSSSLSANESNTSLRRFKLKKEAREKSLFQPKPRATLPPASRPRPSPVPKSEPGTPPTLPGSSNNTAIDVDAKPNIKPSPSPTPRVSTPAPSQPQTSSDVKPSDSSKDTKPGYQEYRLMSCNRHGWKYDVMKLDSRSPVDIFTWTGPVKLNRKEPRREVETTSNVAVGPMLGLDGKPVLDAKGQVVMVGADGRPIQEEAGEPKDKDKDKDKGKKKKFQKKTKQVFLVPEAVRALRREERYPWVMEDSAGQEFWVGRMEEAAKSETHALFMPAQDNQFRFVPAHRWYKFQKRRANAPVMSLEEAEKLMAKLAKNKDPERWLIRQRAEGSGSSLVHDAGGQSLGPGGRRLRAVDAGMRGLFEEDDEEGLDGEVQRRRQRERGAEGEVDEAEFEEEFADDDEQVKLDGQAEDEEAKELEERLKREYRNANKTREGYIDDSDEEEEGEHLTGAGKAMKKLMRKADKSGAYDSDDNENPYASSEEEEEEEEIIPTQSQVEAQLQQQKLQEQQQQQATSESRSGSATPAPRPANSSNPQRSTSRTGSPAPGSVSASGVKLEGSPPPTSPSLGMGGHSVVAKRATSPKAPGLKLKTSPPSSGTPQPGSRATSPLAGAGSRATSPAPGVASGAVVPPKKRKAEGGDATSPTNSAGPHKHKKRKGVPGSGAGANGAGPALTPATELTVDLLVNWLRTREATTRECIQHFQPCLTDEDKKGMFTVLVKEVATLKNGSLVLKPQYRDGQAAAAES